MGVGTTQGVVPFGFLRSGPPLRMDLWPFLRDTYVRTGIGIGFSFSLESTHSAWNRTVRRRGASHIVGEEKGGIGTETSKEKHVEGSLGQVSDTSDFYTKN